MVAVRRRDRTGFWLDEHRPDPGGVRTGRDEPAVVEGSGSARGESCPCGCGAAVVDKAGHDASGHDANDHMVATARQTRLAAARLETAVRQLAAHAPDAPEFRVAARMLSETLDLHSSLVDWCHGERTVGRDLRARSAQWSGRSGEIDQLLAHAHQLVVSA